MQGDHHTKRSKYNPVVSWHKIKLNTEGRSDTCAKVLTVHIGSREALEDAMVRELEPGGSEKNKLRLLVQGQSDWKVFAGMQHMYRGLRFDTEVPVGSRDQELP